MKHSWIEIVGEYFDGLSKCANCGMTVEDSDKQNWLGCEADRVGEKK